MQNGLGVIIGNNMAREMQKNAFKLACELDYSTMLTPARVFTFKFAQETFPSASLTLASIT